MRGVLFCVTHFETVCIWTPIGKRTLIFLLVFKSYFLDSCTFYFSPSIGVQIHSMSGVCQAPGAVFYSDTKAPGAVFYLDTKVRGAVFYSDTKAPGAVFHFVRVTLELHTNGKIEVVFSFKSEIIFL